MPKRAPMPGDVHGPWVRTAAAPRHDVRRVGFFRRRSVLVLQFQEMRRSGPIDEEGHVEPAALEYRWRDATIDDAVERT